MISNKEKEYELEEKKLFNLILDSTLFPLPSNTNRVDIQNPYFINDLGIELIFQTQCNQQCDYCYIHKYGKDLYPIKVTKEETLNNINLIFDYIFCQRKNYLYEIELFGGDIFHNEIYFDVLDIYDKYLKEIKNNFKDIFNKQTTICCPCNLSWVVERPHLIEKFRKYSNYFKDEYNVFLSFSWSTDGYYAVNSREKKVLTEEYFDTIFKFCQEFKCGYHPMVAPENIKTWCENYDWWMEKYEQYDLVRPGYFQPYLLEVRNDNWTPELTEYYCKFLRHLMEWRLKMCDNDIEKLSYHLLQGNGSNNTLLGSRGSDPLILYDKKGYYKQEEGMGCSGQKLVHFDCSRLAIVPCHRTSYYQFIPAIFITDEEKKHIIDFKPNNVGSYITWRFHKTENEPICSHCSYYKICKQGCLGSQFESTGELYMPITSLCNFYKTIYEFLYKLYKEYGIIDFINTQEWFHNQQYAWDWLKDKMRQEGDLNGFTSN